MKLVLQIAAGMLLAWIALIVVAVIAGHAAFP